MAYNTPMNNLQEPVKERSSVIPGVSGESRNAPYGPKACAYDDVWSLKSESDMHDHKENGFRVGKTSGPSQAGMGESSVKP